jgi:hypothetical protein
MQLVKKTNLAANKTAKKHSAKPKQTPKHKKEVVNSKTHHNNNMTPKIHSHKKSQKTKTQKTKPLNSVVPITSLGKIAVKCLPYSNPQNIRDNS